MEWALPGTGARIERLIRNNNVLRRIRIAREIMKPMVGPFLIWTWLNLESDEVTSLLEMISPRMIPGIRTNELENNLERGLREVVRSGSSREERTAAQAALAALTDIDTSESRLLFRLLFRISLEEALATAAYHYIFHGGRRPWLNSLDDNN